MGCGCKGSSYEAPQPQQKVEKAPRTVTAIDESYYARRVYNGPEPKPSSTKA